MIITCDPLMPGAGLAIATVPILLCLREGLISSSKYLACSPNNILDKTKKSRERRIIIIRLSMGNNNGKFNELTRNCLIIL